MLNVGLVYLDKCFIVVVWEACPIRTELQTVIVSGSLNLVSFTHVTLGSVYLPSREPDTAVLIILCNSSFPSGVVLVIDTLVRERYLGGCLCGSRRSPDIVYRSVSYFCCGSKNYLTADGGWLLWKDWYLKMGDRLSVTGPSWWNLLLRVTLEWERLTSC